MFNRIKKIIKLSKKDLKTLENLTEEQIDKLPDDGDGGAVFFGEGTSEEYKEMQERDKGFMGKIFGL